MGKFKIKVIFGASFVILAFLLMFVDALYHVDFNSKYSMALTHGMHGGHGAHGSERLKMGPVDFEDLVSFPLRTPEDAIEYLPYVEKDGVKEFYLTVDEIRWEYQSGKYLHAWAFNGQVPGPEIRVNEGDKLRVIVQNNLPVETSVHWHGLHVENEADGIPEYTQYPIKPGEQYTYEFTAANAGTKFYHSHGSRHGDSVIQMDMGLSGPLTVLPKPVEGEEPKVYDKEYTFLLDEWSVDENGFNSAIASLVGGHEHGGHGYNLFTINGRAYPDIPAMEVKENETVLVRLVNVGTQEIHPMHLHGHSFKVIATDGHPVNEYVQNMYDVFTVTPAERIDFEFVADNPGVWLYHCHHLHHASAGMATLLKYEGYEPCCLESEEKSSEYLKQQLEDYYGS